MYISAERRANTCHVESVLTSLPAPQFDDRFPSHPSHSLQFYPLTVASRTLLLSQIPSAIFFNF